MERVETARWSRLGRYSSAEGRDVINAGSSTADAALYFGGCESANLDKVA